VTAFESGCGSGSDITEGSRPSGSGSASNIVGTAVGVPGVSMPLIGPAVVGGAVCPGGSEGEDVMVGSAVAAVGSNVSGSIVELPPTVGCGVGGLVGRSVGITATVGMGVGDTVGERVGENVGEAVGMLVGAKDGRGVG